MRACGVRLRLQLVEPAGDVREPVGGVAVDAIAQFIELSALLFFQTIDARAELRDPVADVCGCPRRCS